MKIDYSNMPNGASKWNFTLRYVYNVIRSWYKFHYKFPWVRYHGFVRVMKYSTFAKFDIELGDNVQIGKYCSIATDAKIGNNVLFAGRVCCIAGNDHLFDEPCRTIWDSPRGSHRKLVVEDDVWIGHGSILMGGITVGRGSIVAAGSVVTKDIPPCEVWGGVPAKKIKNRFKTDEDKIKHLEFLSTL